MKEVQSLPQDKIVIEKQAQQEKQNKLVGRIIPRKGHTIYEVNLKNGDVNPATFEEGIARFRENIQGSNDVEKHINRFNDMVANPMVKKIKVNQDCLYVSALNLKNLKKKLQQAGIIK